MKSEERPFITGSTPFEEHGPCEFDDNSSEDKEEHDDREIRPILAHDCPGENCEKCAQRADYSSPSPSDTKYKTIDFNLPRKKGHNEEEKDTEVKCTKLIYDVITHYFKEFDDSASDCSTFFFVDPDQPLQDRYQQDTDTEYSNYGAAGAWNGRAGSTWTSDDHDTKEPDIIESDDNGIEFGVKDDNQNDPEQLQQTILLYCDGELSVENELLFDVKNEDDSEVLSEKTIAESERTNFTSRSRII